MEPARDVETANRLYTRELRIPNRGKNAHSSRNGTCVGDMR